MEISQKKDVVILDSDQDLAQSIKLYLEDSFRVHLVKNPTQLLRILKQTKCDYLISEVDFPKSKFQKVIKFVKNSHPEINIILMYTFFDGEGILEKTVLSKADDFIFKPFDVRILKSKLDQLVQKKEKSSRFSRNYH